MTLDNLVGRSLESINPNMDMIQRLLDALRKQRNVADYSGDLVMDSTMQACLEWADQLLTVVEAHLKN